MRPRFTTGELHLLRRLDTPRKVHRWLKALPYNHEARGETLRTFRTVRRLNTAHCLEAALTAAAILEQHGYPPLLLDLESWDDLDHVVFLFREDGRYGTVAKSRDPGLHGRKPIFDSLEVLVRSYVPGYIDFTGRITGYGTYDLRDLRSVDWRTATGNVWKVERVLIGMPHRSLRTSDMEYAWWHRRFVRYKARFPDRRPAYFPNRGEWL